MLNRPLPLSLSHGFSRKRVVRSQEKCARRFLRSGIPRAVLFVLVGLVAVGGVWGQTAYTWAAGDVAGNWNDETNWSPVGVPGGDTGDTATIDAAATVDSLGTTNGGTGAVTIAGLTLDGGATLNMDQSLTVNVTAEVFTGTLDTGTQALSVSVLDARGTLNGSVVVTVTDTASFGDGVTAPTVDPNLGFVVTNDTAIDIGAGNDLSLSNAANDFSTVVTSTGQNVTLVDANAIDLGSSTVGGDLDVTAGGNINRQWDI